MIALFFALLLEAIADGPPTTVSRSASLSFSPGFVPSATPAAGGEKIVTLIVIFSVLGVVAILLTIVCCTRRTQIQKGEGAVRPVSNAILAPEQESLATFDNGALLPGKLKYARFDV
jgi:hypothetical protein